MVLFGTVEIFLFSWVFGIDKAWEEIHHGSDWEIPKIYKFILKYVTPFFLVVILVSWFFQEGISVITMQNISEANKKYILGTRIGLLVLFVILAFLVRLAWKRRGRSKEEE